MEKLQIVYVDKKTLIPYAKNAKIHTSRQIEQIRNSIAKFGFNDPIAVDKNNVIIEGHGRLLAVMDMEEVKEVPIIRLDKLTEKQRKAYTIAHNKLTTNTGFDLDILAQEIASIEDDIDFTDIGFNEAELLELTIDDGTAEIPAEHFSATDIGNGYTIPKLEPVLSVPAEDQKSADEFQKRNSEFFKENNGVEQVTKEDIDYYSQKAKQRLNRRIMIVYSTDDEELFLKGILLQKNDKPLPVVIDVRDIMKAEEVNNGVESEE